MASRQKSESPKGTHPFGDLSTYKTALDELLESHPGKIDDAAYRRLLGIYFEIPFQVPWPESRPISVFLGQTFIIMSLRPERRSVESHLGFPATQTITGVTLAGPAIDLSTLDEAAMSDLFDFGLEFLNTFLTAYSLVTKDGDVGPVTLPALSIHSLWGSINANKGLAEVEKILLLNPTGVLYEKDTIPDSIGAEIIRLSTALTGPGYPFLTSWQFRIEGQSHLWKGRFHVAAILIASAFEARANELLRYFYWKEGRTEKEAQSVLKSVPFVKRVTSEFHERLGGNFSIKKAGAIRNWLRLTHGLRNRVVHGGYRPTKEETEASLKSMIEAWDYVMRLVRRRIKRFPELSPYIALRGDKFLWPTGMSESDKQKAFDTLANAVHRSLRPNTSQGEP